MLSQPSFLDAELIGVNDLLQCIVQRLLLRKVFVIGNDGENSELHADSPTLEVLICPTLLH